MTDDEAMRDYVRRLFTDDEEPQPIPAASTAPGNHVPSEGDNPAAPADAGDDSARDFAAELFARAHLD